LFCHVSSIKVTFSCMQQTRPLLEQSLFTTAHHKHTQTHTRCSECEVSCVCVFICACCKKCLLATRTKHVAALCFSVDQGDA
jgi:hypothetical protein